MLSVGVASLLDFGGHLETLVRQSKPQALDLVISFEPLTQMKGIRAYYSFYYFGCCALGF